MHEINYYTKIIYNNRVKSNYPDELVEYLIKRFGLQGKLLDIGCGDKTFTNSFLKKGINAIGIDVPEYNAETQMLPFVIDSFDIIFCKSMIEHLYNPEIFLYECRKVLKPDGIIIILTPNWESQWKTFYEDPTHVHPYTKQSLYDLLNIHKFDNVKSEIFYQYPLCWKFPLLKIFKLFIPIKIARFLTQITKIKYFRWMNETMILTTGKKNKHK